MLISSQCMANTIQVVCFGVLDPQTSVLDNDQHLVCLMPFTQAKSEEDNVFKDLFSVT